MTSRTWVGSYDSLDKADNSAITFLGLLAISFLGLLAISGGVSCRKEAGESTLSTRLTTAP